MITETRWGPGGFYGQIGGVMELKQGDAVLIRGKILSVDGNFATVGTSSTGFAIVPLSAIVAIGEQKKSISLGERREFHRQLASFLRRWAKHTSYIHNIGCDCRAFEKQAEIFVRELRQHGAALKRSTGD